MESGRAGSADEPARSAHDELRAELGRLEAGRRRQATEIATLSEVVSNFQRGLKALQAENAELRAESADLRESLAATSPGGSRAHDELIELAIEAGPAAPCVARRAVARALGVRVTASALADAELLTSELVTNSVRHSGISTGDELVVRLRVWDDRCRVEVEDAGHDGVIAPRPPDLGSVGGMGLKLVQALSERWGLVRAAGGPTRVWAQLQCPARSAR